MIPTLLWRCPLCAAHDALVQQARRLRADVVRCRECGAGWRVRRTPGRGFFLERLEGARRTGDERPLAAWYEAMKAGLALVPLPEAAVPLPDDWGADEVLYLASGRAELWAASEPPPLSAPRQGAGRLLLTDRRLAWLAGGTCRSFPLARLNAAQAYLDEGLVLMVEMDLFLVRFADESLLKWVSYLGLMAARVEAASGHCVAVSHW